MCDGVLYWCVLCVVFACTRVSLCASIQIEKFNCDCMNCVMLIHNLFNLVGIYSNLGECMRHYIFVACNFWHNLKSLSNYESLSCL